MISKTDLIIDLAREYRLDPSYMAYLNEGNANSGNWNHAGRPGEKGGSAPGEGNSLVEKTKIANRKYWELSDNDAPQTEIDYWIKKIKDLDEDRHNLANIYDNITNGNLDKKNIDYLSDDGVEGQIKQAIQEHFDARQKYEEIDELLDSLDPLEDFDKGTPEYIEQSKKISSLKKELKIQELKINKTEEKASDIIHEFEIGYENGEEYGW